MVKVVVHQRLTLNKFVLSTDVEEKRVKLQGQLSFCFDPEDTIASNVFVKIGEKTVGFIDKQELVSFCEKTLETWGAKLAKPKTKEEKIVEKAITA